MVDEAHATGILGPGGRGAVAEAGLEGEVDVVVGTLGKALGSYGAYACASSEMVRYLINTARSLIFSTAPSPPGGRRRAGGARAACRSARTACSACAANARALRRALAAEGFPVAAGLEMHIVPLIVGDERATMRLCQEAIERGVFAQAIRPPTVAPGASRLRLTAMASHTASELQMAAGVLGRATRDLGLDPELMAPAIPEQLLAADEDALQEAELVALESARSYTSAPMSAAPFDLEREGEGFRAQVRTPAGIFAEAQEPLDAEHLSDEPQLPGQPSAGPDAPFDFERETDSARAA